ncbi:PREDICTED: putative nuclease HARBI1 [Prunus dulcis]|uniref:PREDICTED: putative nuclease HARBI1 n=2 Tax=Prunus dulcis TaxID=3755 RepID=A0A5E4FB29_PRUDU|nr:PREDICTED: putative nuclease HARBI1 [Prunus dulcis]
MAAGGGGGRAAKSTTKGKAKNKKRHNKKPLSQHHLVSLVATATSLAHSFLSQNDLLLLPSQTLTLETLLSSTSTSLSTLLCFPNPPPQPPLRPPPPPLECWFSRFLSATSASRNFDSRWSHTFRMSEHSFSILLSLLSPFLNSTIPSIPPNFVLAAAIYRLAHGASYKAVGRRFGLDSVEACRAFFAVCKAVSDKLGNLFEFRSDIARIVGGFGWISLPNCCGVLGFGRFGVGGEVLGPNGSLLVQALVDSEGRFLDVSAGWPSAMKLESIFRQTKLYLGVEESRDLLNGPVYELGNGKAIPQYILGDSCFPLLPWLLTPYIRSDEADSFGSLEKAFNSVHSRAMGLVDTAFGRVRARWQLLSRQWKEECVEFLPFVIVTGCLLHNFLIKCSEPMPDDNVKSLREEELPVFHGQVDESGERMRDVLAAHLSRVSLRR